PGTRPESLRHNRDRGDNCGPRRQLRGGPQRQGTCRSPGTKSSPCSTKSSSAGREWRIVVAVLISSRPVSARKLARALRLDYEQRPGASMIEALANAIVKPAGKHACSTPTTGRAVGSRSPKRSSRVSLLG